MIPGPGLIALLLLIILTGLVAQNYIGKKLLRFGERILNKIPVLRNIYNTTKQFAEGLAQSDKNAFRQMVLVEYPRQGIFSPGFLIGDSPEEASQKTENQLVSIFIPTPPNPTNGFLIFVPKNQVTLLDMSIEDGLKLFVSAGVIKPNNKEKVSGK